MFEDFAILLRRLIPHDTYYAHDDWDRRTENICEEDMEFGNGHAHCMSMLLGSAGESVPVADNDLCLGTVAARAVHRARPRARPSLAGQGRRLVAVAAARASATIGSRDLPTSSRCSSSPAIAVLFGVGRLPRALPQRPLPAARSSDPVEGPVAAAPVPEGQPGDDRTPEPRARERDAQAPAGRHRTPTRSRPSRRSRSCRRTSAAPTSMRSASRGMPEPANRQQRRLQQRLQQGGRARRATPRQRGKRR